MITFQQLTEGYQRASLGPASCDVISCGDDAFREIVDKIAEASANLSPDGRHLEIDPRATEWRRQALAGEAPVFFMGAIVGNGSMAKNEIRFVNSKRPERNHTITT